METSEQYYRFINAFIGSMQSFDFREETHRRIAGSYFLSMIQSSSMKTVYEVIMQYKEGFLSTAIRSFRSEGKMSTKDTKTRSFFIRAYPGHIALPLHVTDVRFNKEVLLHCYPEKVAANEIAKEFFARGLITSEEATQLKEMIPFCDQYLTQNNIVKRYEYFFNFKQLELITNLVNKVILIPPHPTLLDDLTSYFDKLVKDKCVKREDPISLAAFIHNSFMYLSPFSKYNDEYARTLANWILITSGLKPFYSTEDYRLAYTKDYTETERKDFNPKIQSINLTLFIYQWQISPICLLCCKSAQESVKSCDKCKFIFCSESCFTNNIKTHTNFCKELFYISLNKLGEQYMEQFKAYYAERIKKVFILQNIAPKLYVTKVYHSVVEKAKIYEEKGLKPSEVHNSEWLQYQFSLDIQSIEFKPHYYDIMKDCQQILKDTQTAKKKIEKLLKIAKRTKLTSGKWLIQVGQSDVDKVYHELIKFIIDSEKFKSFEIQYIKVSSTARARVFGKHAIIIQTEKFDPNFKGLFKELQVFYKPDIFTILGIYVAELKNF